MTVALKQIQAVVAVCEERSFTRAAARENATQSGISQHVAAVERTLGVRLFERSAAGVTPTPAGLRYYRRCVEALEQLEQAGVEAQSLSGAVAGELRVGLMPTITRAALAPTLQAFKPLYPDVRLHVVEGYSGLLTDMVLADELDFAVVPTFEGRTGLRTRLLVRDREMLVSNAASGRSHLEAVRLRECGPLRIVVPGRSNIRRRNIEVYLQTHGVEIADMIEMDAMIGTLEFVARSEWVAILSGLICAADIDGRARTVNPIFDPPLFAEFVTISPARRTLSVQARLFLSQLEAEIARIQEIWDNPRAAAIPHAKRPPRKPRGTPRSR